MKTSLRLIILLCFSLTLFGCKKYIQQKEQDALMNAITSGSWIVEQYFEGSQNITSNFLNYEFRFYNDGTVKGTRADSTATGTWAGSVSNRTISSDFPTANDPVKKLNGVWKITDSAADYVRAEIGTGTARKEVRLRKKA